MTSQKFAAADILGLSPAIDPTQSPKQYVIDGKNFIFDSIGPKSIFGNRLLVPQSRMHPAYMQGIRLKLKTGDRTFTFDGDGIWEWDEDAGGWRSIYRTPDTTVAPSRWTMGYLADLVYFCHPNVGILVYDPDLEICRTHQSLGVGTPEEALALTVNNGRLVVVSSLFHTWSDPSDGLNFDPKLGGAGFQLLSDRVSGRPITVSSYNGGTLTWTTGGVLRSEFTGDAAVYRHRSLNTEYRPVNSFCLVRVDDDTSIILDERGLFQCKGDNITPYAPLFNEFLISYLKKIRAKVGENVRMEWDEQSRLLYVSVSSTYSDPLYERCFVLYSSLDKWGSFDEQHYGILPIQISNSLRDNDYYGFTDGEGRVRYWNNNRNRELSPWAADNRAANLHYPVIQLTPEFGDQGVIVSSNGKASTFAKSSVGSRAGYYMLDSIRPVTPQVQGLAAQIKIGLFRPLSDAASDQMAETINVMVRSHISAPEEGYPEDEDSSQYELGTLSFVTFGLTIRSHVDGLTTYQSCVPDLVRFDPASRYYSCSIPGIWHSVEIRADELTESFHLHTLELTAINAGRLL